MGYTTKFSGAINLSRKLTLAEAKELLEIAEMDRDDAKAITGRNAYLQWVPSTSLDQIVWDGGEKFYDYPELMEWVCSWLAAKKITANGMLFWSGESTGDTGTISVFNNTVTCATTGAPAQKQSNPLDMRQLQKMALDLATGREAADAAKDSA